jgi:hypothetical protein
VETSKPAKPSFKTGFTSRDKHALVCNYRISDRTPASDFQKPKSGFPEPDVVIWVIHHSASSDHLGID